MQERPLGPIIAIDFGSSFCRVGIWENDKVHIIPNEQGCSATPACVAFTETKCLVGQDAINQAPMNPLNTIFNPKRLFGHRYLDPPVQSYMKQQSIKVVNCEATPRFEVEYKGTTDYFCPKEISTLIIERLKKSAESFLGLQIKNAVITVPADFNQRQRCAVKCACTKAGLNVLRLIVEPTAAALSYGLNKKFDEPKNIIVLDLGGGTFDVSLLNIEDSIFEVKATRGNTQLGGIDFDNRLVEYFCEEFRTTHHFDLRSNPSSLRRLQNACEHAKQILSASPEAVINIESLINGIHFQSTITREKFEELCNDLFMLTIDAIEKVLQDANMDMWSIHEILMVGGSSRIPKIQKLVSDYFYGKAIHHGVNPDEMVISGAAIHAAILSNDCSEQIRDVVALDVVPHSIGIETSGGVMTPIIVKNTLVPTTKIEVASTSEDNQPGIRILIYEGESSYTKDNYLLDIFDMKGIPPAPKSVPKVELAFYVDVNGMVNVKADIKPLNNDMDISLH